MVPRTDIRHSRVGLIFALCSLAAAPAAQGHSISTIEGEAVVHRDRVELKVKVRPEDILLSAGMSLIVDDRIAKSVIEKGAEAHKKFLLNRLRP